MTTPLSRRYDVFVDSGGFYALFDATDRHHTEAVAAFAHAVERRRRICTTNFVVAETHALLLNRTHRTRALTYIREVHASQIGLERVQVVDESEALAIIEQYDDKDFSYSDPTSFAVMRRLGIDAALAFDRHFAQFGFSAAPQ